MTQAAQLRLVLLLAECADNLNLADSVFFPYHFIPKERNAFAELGLNPGPLASQAAALTARP